MKFNVVFMFFCLNGTSIKIQKYLVGVIDDRNSFSLMRARRGRVGIITLLLKKLRNLTVKVHFIVL